MGREVELRLEVPVSTIDDVARLPWLREVSSDTPKCEKLVSLYFDTAKSKLREHGLVLRVRYAGGPDQENVGFVPNITTAGIGHWSRDDLQDALTTGVTPGAQVLGSTMAEVVTDIAGLPEGDQRAIAAYIKSLPSRPTPAP